MNLDKSKKRIAKRAKMGFQGYPQISIRYTGNTSGHADEVLVEFVAEEGAEVQQERFASKLDAREDESIQSALVKMIERSEAKTVVQMDGISQLNGELPPA
jgi:thymidylate synthase ThyX